MVLPKPLVPVGDRPILDLILRQLGHDGYRHVDLCVGHLGALIQTYFSDPRNVPEGMTLDYQWEDEPLGTAGALKQLSDIDAPFLVMNGDILTDLCYRSLMDHHVETGASLTIATHQVDHQVALGVIEQDAGMVTGYTEKPTLHYHVSMGVYVYNPSVLDHIPEGQFDFPDVVNELLGAGEPVASYPFDGNWFDIGTPGDHDRAVAHIQDNPGSLLRGAGPVAASTEPA